jgi:hypothetical protein
MFNQNEVVDLDDATRQRLTAIRNQAPSMFTESDGTLQTLEDMYREERLLASFSAFQLEEASKPTAERPNTPPGQRGNDENKNKNATQFSSRTFNAVGVG